MKYTKLFVIALLLSFCWSFSSKSANPSSITGVVKEIEYRVTDNSTACDVSNLKEYIIHFENGGIYVLSSYEFKECPVFPGQKIRIYQKEKTGLFIHYETVVEIL